MSEPDMVPDRADTAAADAAADCLSADCGVMQSVLAPAGVEAQQVAELTWVLLIGGGVIWTLVMLLALRAAQARAGSVNEAIARRLVVWGGAVLPSIVLGVLLAYGLGVMSDLHAPGSDLRIAVSGERYWWRIRYAAGGRDSDWQATFLAPADDTSVDTANELYLPLGERTELLLYSPDVIHSLWIPSLAGKMDLIPGRVNRLLLQPTRSGRFRAVCAEFCGSGHARMALTVVVTDRSGFDRWLAQQARTQRDADSAGYRAFMAAGCAACHRIRGTGAEGRIGPDLTHVGSRTTLGAGLLPTTRANLRRFIAGPAHLKPGVRMPAFDMLPPADLDAIAGWLAGLQ